MNPNPPLRVILLIALPAEAKPIRQGLGLERDNRVAELPLYRRDRIALAITGAGPERARASLQQLLRRYPADEPIRWINCGIAGHPTQPLGSCLPIGEIGDAQGSPPAQADPIPGATTPPCPLTSLEHPSHDYRHPAATDMEASALIGLLRRLRPGDRFHCLKVVSDNRESGTRQINGKQVAAWTGQLLPLLQGLLSEPTQGGAHHARPG